MPISGIQNMQNAMNGMTTPSKSLNLPVLNNGARVHDANVNLADVMKMLMHINDSIVALAKAVERIDRRAHTSELQQHVMMLQQQQQKK